MAAWQEVGRYNFATQTLSGFGIGFISIDSKPHLRITVPTGGTTHFYRLEASPVDG